MKFTSLFVIALTRCNTPWSPIELPQRQSVVRVYVKSGDYKREKTLLQYSNTPIVLQPTAPLLHSYSTRTPIVLSCTPKFFGVLEQRLSPLGDYHRRKGDEQIFLFTVLFVIALTRCDTLWSPIELPQRQSVVRVYVKSGNYHRREGDEQIFLFTVLFVRALARFCTPCSSI